jgi:hypothetical protein
MSPSLDTAAPARAQRTSQEGLAALGELARGPSVERAVEAIREMLGMEVAYATRMTETEQIFGILRGDGESFGVGEGSVLPVEQTYCSGILAGRLPNLICDVQGDPRASSLPVSTAADVGSFASVPLTFSDGRTYGTLCAASHSAKPDLSERDLQFLHVFARIVADQLEREELEGAARDAEVKGAVIQTLVAAVEARDSYTAEHSEAVVAWAVAVAQELGLSGHELTDIEHVALLHDIGKISVPDAILAKPGPLSDEEWKVMRRHPINSEALIKSVPSLERLAPALRAEHERWDGAGYPDGLAGQEIPIASRITFVCDAYHAMTSNRPYRKALSPETARQRIAESSGTQFCPTAAQGLLDVLKRSS